MAEVESAVKRTILLPIDNSEHSESAFTWFIETEKRDGDKIIFAHLIVPPIMASMSLYHAAVKATDEYKDSLHTHIEQAKKLMNKYEEKCKAANVEYEMHLESCQGSIGADIIKLSKTTHSKFIVIGSRGLSHKQRNIIGSVSSYVVRHSRIPVIIVPPEHPINPY